MREAANDNIRIANLPATTPEDRFATRSRIAADAKQAAKGVRRQRTRINKRQAIGDPGCPANDNQAWPLAKALLAEKNHELLKYAMAYRKIEVSATSEAELRGGSQGSDFMALDQRTWLNGKGDVVYKGARELTAGRFGADKPQTKDTPGEKKQEWREWRGDVPVNDMIDNKRLLARLRSALGPLVEPFEALVIEGKTYETVGREMGVYNKMGATGAARAVAHMGLVTVRDILGGVRRRDCAA